ncbi:MAG TPA: TolC family protein [Prolixibacteraceae bacterium]
MGRLNAKLTFSGIIVCLLMIPSMSVHAQDTIRYSLSLEDIVSLAIEQSSSVKYAQNQNVNYYWRWKNFKTRNRPQLVLSGNLPNYTQSNVGVTQPDGSLAFKQVTNLSTSAGLSLNQSIALTGTYISASTSAIRFQDYNAKTVNFSGSPFSFGFYQPIFAINWLKWQQKTEPLVYDEAQKNFIETIESISLNTMYRFFRYLLVQTNFNLASSNLKNSNNNLKIAQTKKDLGTISENNYARNELAVLNAQKALNRATIDLRNADFELKSYVGLPQDRKIELQMPLNITLFDIDLVKALEEANANRKEGSNYKRRLIEADRNLISAKRSTGLSATLQGSYGLSNSAPTMEGIYQKPERQQTLSLALSIPILDWGQSASAVKLAESQRDLVIYDVEKDRTDFERSIVVQVEQFSLMKDQLVTAKEADKVAANGYLIALKQFQNGETTITDLNIALSEKDNAKRDYIYSLQTYWEAYYKLRILTLYDFDKNQKIGYINPLYTKDK